MNIPKVNQASARVLDGIWSATAGKEVDLDRPGYLHFHAERLSGCVLAISHTFEQNGDLMKDPEIVFFRAAESHWHALDCTQHPLGLYTECATLNEGKIETFRPRSMRSVTGLANLWMKNLRHQFPEVAAMVKRAA